MAISYDGNQRALGREVMKLMAASLPTDGATRKRNVVNICTKAGAPSNDTAGEVAHKNGDLCWDTTNDDVYVASAVDASADETTWTKIVD